jgi:hypothetical protein
VRPDPWMVVLGTRTLCRRVVERAGPWYGTRLSGYTGSGPPQETNVHSLVPDPRLSDPQDL